jgi:hypothetical protein
MTKLEFANNFDRELSVLRCLRAIRQEVEDDPKQRTVLWERYHNLQKELRELDPTSPELKIGISGKPLVAGLQD